MGIVPLGGEFRSGIHRADFHPHDRHLYVSGMDGWGTYTTDDGRERWRFYVGGPIRFDPVIDRGRVFANNRRSRGASED